MFRIVTRGLKIHFGLLDFVCIYPTTRQLLVFPLEKFKVAAAVI